MLTTKTTYETTTFYKWHNGELVPYTKQVPYFRYTHSLWERISNILGRNRYV